MDQTREHSDLQQYPWSGKFGTKAEIDDYFGGNKVQCLFCGKWFKALTQHLGRTHDITPDDTGNGSACRGGVDCAELGPARSSAKTCWKGAKKVFGHP